MKKLIVNILVTGIFIVAGCKMNTVNPKDVAQKFFTALKDKNFEDAKKYATKESRSMLDLIKNSVQEENGAAGKERDIYVSNQEIDGDNATVDVMTSDSKTPVTVSMKKEDGQWKVAFDINSIMNMAEDAVGNESTDAENKINNMDSLKEAMDALPGEMDSLRKSLQR